MANLNDVLQGLVNLNSKMANNINSLLDSVGEGFLDVGELTKNDNILTLKNAVILVNGTAIKIEELSTSFEGDKICFLEYDVDKNLKLTTFEVVDENFNYDLSLYLATSKYFALARQFGDVYEDRREADNASENASIVSALKNAGSLKAVDYEEGLDLDLDIGIDLGDLDLNGVVKAIDVEDGTIEDVDIDYVTKAELDETLANLGVDTTVDYVFQEELENYVTKEELDNLDVNVDLSAYATKEELSAYATKEELNEAKTEADEEIQAILTDHINPMKDNYQLKNDTTLQTSDKTIVGAINELFQSANNGKELIASSIGEPLSSDQTFQAMSTDIDSLLGTFKANMMNSGVTVEANDKFKQLIDKLANLNDAGGSNIQVISGEYDFDQMVSKVFTLTDDYTYSISINPSLGYIELEFDTPPILIYVENYVHLKLASIADYEFVSNSIYDTVLNNEVVLSTYNYGDSVPQGDIYHVHPIIEDNKYTIPVSIDIYEDAYVDQDYTPTLQDKHCRWVAVCGDNTEDTTLRDSLASILQGEGVSVTEEDDMASLISKVDIEFDKQVTPQGTAESSDVAQGKTFINSTGELLTGTGALLNLPGLVYDYGNLDTTLIGEFKVQYYYGGSTGYTYNDDHIYIKNAATNDQSSANNIIVSDKMFPLETFTEVRITYKTNDYTEGDNASFSTYYTKMSDSNPTLIIVYDNEVTLAKSTSITTQVISLSNTDRPHGFRFYVPGYWISSGGNSNSCYLYVYKIEFC